MTPAVMLRIGSLLPSGLGDTLTWVAQLLWDFLGSWNRHPIAKMKQRQKKGRRPHRPRRAGKDGGRPSQVTPVLACQEGKDANNPVATQETRELGDNLGANPHVPCGSHSQEEGARHCEPSERRGEGTTAQLEMEEHLEKVGDGPKPPLESRSWSWQDGEGEKPGGGLLPCGKEATSCPPGDGSMGHPFPETHPVLSFFYRPEEEDGDEDWPSDWDGDNAGGCSGADWTHEEGEPEGDSATVPGRPIRPRPEEQEFRVSFYLPGPTLEAVGDPWIPPEKPWPMRRGLPGRIRCCELGCHGGEGPAPGETKDPQGNRTAKKVRFSSVVTVHPLWVWPFASRAARRGPWEELARDRSRFRRRIEQLEPILGPCLEPGHRACAWRKIQEAAVEAAERETQVPLSGGLGRQHTPLLASLPSMEDPGVRDGRLG